MADDFLESVLSEEPLEAAPEPAPEPQPEPEPVVEPVAQPEPVVESPPQGKPEDRFVPIAAMLDERDRRKQAEAQLQQFQSQQQPARMPDPLDDPEGWNSHQEARMADALTAQKFQMSEVMAKQAHGEEVVQQAGDWAAHRAQADPAFLMAWQHALRNEPHPIDWIVRQHKRDAIVSAVGDAPSLDDWFTQEAARRGWSQSAPVAAAPFAAVSPAPRPAAPPRSIASEAPASAPVAQDAKAEFEAIFDRR